MLNFIRGLISVDLVMQRLPSFFFHLLSFVIVDGVTCGEEIIRDAAAAVSHDSVFGS